MSQPSILGTHDVDEVYSATATCPVGYNAGELIHVVVWF